MNLKQLLKERGISQTKLAKLMNIPRTTVANWFNGNSYPSKYDHVIKLAEILEVDVAQISNLSTDVSGLRLSETDQKLLALHEEQKRLALAFFEFLKEKT